MSLILALECDPDRGRTLKRLVGEWMDAEVVVAPSTDQAIEFMRQHGPDLILVSALTPPGDDSSLTEFLRQRPEDRQVPTLTVPPLSDHDDEAQQENRRGLRSLFGPRRKPWQHYDQQALSARLRQALEASCSAAQTWTREAGSDAAPALALDYDPHLEELLQDFARALDPQSQVELDRGELGSMHPRARRWSRKDLSWLTEVKLPWGLRVDLRNISSSGVLVESAARFVEGSTTVFQLSGPDRALFIPARVIRSEVAVKDSRGVTYQAAATFEEVMQEAELLGPAAIAIGEQPGPRN